MQEINLMDISDELLILNKHTIDKLYSLDNCVDCIALYIFYYKTAKWQKTNQVKANDTYVIKSLKWGKEKLKKTKDILKQFNLIETIQRRENDKICGWFIKVNYVMSDKKEEIKNIVVSNTPQNQQVAKPTSSDEDTNALKYNIKCLKKEIEMLKEENNKLRLLKESESKSELENIETYKEIINYMNNVYTHKNFTVKIPFSYSYKSKTNQGLINARLKEGYNIEQFKDVIYWGYRKFVEFEFTSKENDSSFKYFRPSTLFSVKHFEEYLNEYRANTSPKE